MSLIKDGLLPRLIHLSGIEDVDIQRDASKTFASLTANTENHIGVFGAPEIKTMLRLCLSTEENCARDGLVSIGNLAVTAKKQLIISKLGGVSVMCQALKSQFASSHQYAARALYRLSAHPNIQTSVIDGGAIAALNKLTKDESPLIRKFAVMVLCNVSSGKQNQAKLAKEGSISSLISTLKDSEEIVTRYGAMAIANMASEASNQVTIAKLGGVTDLVRLAGETGTETSRYAGMALANLSASRQNRAAIVDLGGLVPLVKMAFSTNFETQRAAVLALYNLSCAVSNHMGMIKSDAVSAIAHVGAAEDLECKKYSIMCLANLAANIETRPFATRSGGLQTAITMIKNDDLECRRYACIALCNMGNNTVTQEQIVVHGALPVLLQMAKDDGDVETQRQSLLTISNLASNEINHASMVQKGIMKVLTEAYQSKDLDVKEYASFSFANLCSNPDYTALVGRSGGIPPLIMLTKSFNVNTLCLGLAALRRLADNEDNWPKLIAAGILDSLASAGFSTELEIQRETASCICSLSLSEPHRVEIAYKCIKTMIHLSSSGDEDIARQSVGALANLAEDVNTHEYIARAGGSKCLISLEKHDSLDIQREATRGIANLLSSFRHQSTVIEDGIPGLVQLSYSSDVEVCYHAAMSFRKLSPNLKAHPVLVYAGAFKALFRLVGMPHLNTQKQAAAALRDLCANPEYKARCAEDGGIPTLVNLLRQSDDLLQALALAALRHLSADDILKHPILQERALRPALRAISSNIEDIHLQCAGLIANMSELPENQITMVEESTIVGLVTLAYSKNVEVQQDTARALANLASNEETHMAMFKQGALNALVQLADSKNDLTQRYAAMGMRFLAADPEVRVLIVAHDKFQPFIHLANSDLLEYRRTAAASFASFTLHEGNKSTLIRNGVLPAIYSLALRQDDLAVLRDAAFAIANLSDSPELQVDLLREGVLKVLAVIAFNDDARVQRDVARTYANLAQTDDLRHEIIIQNGLPAILNLAKSLDIACQRYSALSLCNLCSGEHKVRILDDGTVRPLIFLTRFPDTEIQRYASLALAGLALGGKGNSKTRIVEEGAVRPLVDLLRFPDRDVQLSATIAVNSIVLGKGYYLLKFAISTGNDCYTFVIRHGAGY